MRRWENGDAMQRDVKEALKKGRIKNSRDGGIVRHGVTKSVAISCNESQ